MKKFSINTILLLLPLTLVLGQDVTVTAAFDSLRIYAGDRTAFRITVEKPSGLELALPVFTDTIVKNIEILSGPETDSVPLQQGRIRLIHRYIVTSFDSGFYEIKPIYAELKSPAGFNRFFSDYARLEVMKYRVAPADSTAKIYDIIEPYKAPVTLGEMLPWILLSIALLAIAAAIVFIVRRRRKKTGDREVLIIPDPAHVIAFRELERLRAEELWQKGNFKLYYTRLTEILRQYLENRYGVYSLELTTSETLSALLKTGFKKDHNYNLLRNILNSADLVKFAKYIPESSENETAFSESWRFVETTKQVMPDAVPGNEIQGKEGKP